MFGVSVLMFPLQEDSDYSPRTLSAKHNPFKIGNDGFPSGFE